MKFVTRTEHEAFETLESPFLSGEIVLRDSGGERESVQEYEAWPSAGEAERVLEAEAVGWSDGFAATDFSVETPDAYEEEARAELEDSLEEGYDEAEDDEAEYLEGETGDDHALTRMKFEFQTSNRIFRNDGKTSSLLGRKYGRHDFLVKEKGVRLESETDGVLEFETEWFRDWPKLEKAIEKALKMIKDIENAGPAQFNTARKAFPFNVDHLRTRLTASEKRTGVFDRLPQKETKNEKILGATEALEVEITDLPASKWEAAIQSSESFLLDYYESYLRQHELLTLVDDTIKRAQAILDAVNTGGVPAAELVRLRSFLQIVVNYILRGKSVDTKGHPAKATFQLMNRTNFASIYRQLLTQKEKGLFQKVVTTDGILKNIGMDRKTRFFKNGYGSDPAHPHTGPTVYEWLSKIPRGVDVLSATQGGSSLSAAMGRYSVDTKKGAKDRWHVKFETRGTRTGRVRDAKDWVKYASDLFDLASKRDRDAVSLAFQQGNTDESKLTNLVFHARHPELQYRRIKSGEHDLSQEWNSIRDNLVRPVVADVQPELEVFEGPFYSAMEDTEYGSAHEAEDPDQEDPETRAGEDLVFEQFDALEVGGSKEQDPPYGEADIADNEADSGMEALELEAPGFDQAQGAAEEEVLGTDDRTLVTDTLKMPNRWICAIDIMSENPRWGRSGEPYYIAKSRATGVLIGPRHVLTAAHVFDTDAKKAAAVVKQHTVSPARNGNNSKNPFGKIKATAVHASQPYFIRRRVQIDGKTREVPIRQRDDYALVILAKDVAASTHAKMKGALGYWGEDPAVAVLRRLEPSAIQGKQVVVTGYPGDTCGTSKWSGSKADKERKIDDCWRRRNDDWASTQWSGTGTLDVEPDSTAVFHTADTYEGQSGAPICLSVERVLHLAGVHTGSDNAQRNRGVRVTRRMLRELCGWINADAGYQAATIQNDTLIFQPTSAKAGPP